MTVDLHCHTKLSDGSIGIDNLVVLAKKKGIKTIAITDHDCLAGTVRGKIIGERNGVDVIPGVELSCSDPSIEKEVHILCYMPDTPDRLEGLCRQNSLARKKASQFMVLKAAAQHPITGDLVLKCSTGSTNVYKQHIMQALMECNITTDLWGDLYHELFSPESEKNIIVKPKFPSPLEVLSHIKEAGGISVLAHPAHTGCDEAFMHTLVQAGLLGIEVWHPAHNQEQITRLVRFAKANNLLMTGGSDFHGMYSPHVIGLGGIEVPQQHINSLLNYKVRQRRLAKKLEQDNNEKKEG